MMKLETRKLQLTSFIARLFEEQPAMQQASITEIQTATLELIARSGEVLERIPYYRWIQIINSLRRGIPRERVENMERNSSARTPTGHKGIGCHYIRQAMKQVEDPETADRTRIAIIARELAKNDGYPDLSVSIHEVSHQRGYLCKVLGIQRLTQEDIVRWENKAHWVGRRLRRSIPSFFEPAASPQTQPATGESPQQFTLEDIQLAQTLVEKLRGINLEEVIRLKSLVQLLGGNRSENL